MSLSGIYNDNNDTIYSDTHYTRNIFAKEDFYTEIWDLNIGTDEDTSTINIGNVDNDVYINGVIYNPGGGGGGAYIATAIQNPPTDMNGIIVNNLANPPELTLQAADFIHPGIITINAQNIAGQKFFSDGIIAPTVIVTSIDSNNITELNIGASTTQIIDIGSATSGQARMNSGDSVQIGAVPGWTPNIFIGDVANNTTFQSGNNLFGHGLSTDLIKAYTPSPMVIGTFATSINLNVPSILFPGGGAITNFSTSFFDSSVSGAIPLTPNGFHADFQRINNIVYMTYVWNAGAVAATSIDELDVDDPIPNGYRPPAGFASASMVNKSGQTFPGVMLISVLGMVTFLLQEGTNGGVNEWQVGELAGAYAGTISYVGA